jgi:uncharacterized membrane protein YeiB
MKEISTKRIGGYDAARALAIFGMVIVNYKITMNADNSGPEWLIHLCRLIEGKAATTFVILAGVGISLMTKKAYLSANNKVICQHRISLIKRAFFLFILGLAYTPIWPADILHFYGIYLLIAAFVFTRSARTIWFLIVGFIVLFYFLLFTLNYETEWNWETTTYHGFWTVNGMIRHVFFNGFHPVFPWMAFLLFGLWLGRKNMSNPETRRFLMIGSAILLTLSEISSHIIIEYYSSMNLPVALMEDVKALYGTAPMPPTLFFIASAGSTAVLIICLSIMVMEKAGENRWTKPLIHTGQLSLTLYVFHVVVGMAVLEEAGLLENRSLPFSTTASVVFFIAGIFFSTMWRRYHNRGPLEWILRKLT